MLNLVRALVTGGVSAELEAQFAEGREITGISAASADVAAFGRRAKVAQMHLSEGPLQQFGVSYSQPVKSPSEGLRWLSRLSDVLPPLRSRVRALYRIFDRTWEEFFNTSPKVVGFL